MYIRVPRQYRFRSSPRHLEESSSINFILTSKQAQNDTVHHTLTQRQTRLLYFFPQNSTTPMMIAYPIFPSPTIGLLVLLVQTYSLVKGSFTVAPPVHAYTTRTAMAPSRGNAFGSPIRRDFGGGSVLPWTMTTTRQRQQPALLKHYHWALRRVYLSDTGLWFKNNNNDENDDDDEEEDPNNNGSIYITTTTGEGTTRKSEELLHDQRMDDPKFVERNKYWVIIVDDEEPIRMSVGNFLYDQGYQVTACADADALLEVCAKPGNDGNLPAVPNVIISDIRMPGKDGIELLGLIRSDERLERVPVILLTAKAMTQDRILGYKAGADVYLPKPFDPDELLSIVDNAIQRRREMTGKTGGLRDLKEDMANIKQLMRKNSANVVKKTDIFLTDKERDVLEFICKGYTNGEIAKERGVSVIGVNRTIQKIYLTTQTTTRTELVRWAIETGYVSAR